MTVKYNTNNGITFMSLLGLLFIALKLMGKIEWSWIWVLAPFWGPVVAVVLICVALAYNQTRRR